MTKRDWSNGGAYFKSLTEVHQALAEMGKGLAVVLSQADSGYKAECRPRNFSRSPKILRAKRQSIEKKGKTALIAFRD